MKTIEKKVRGGRTVEEVDELREKRDQLRRKAEDLQREIDRKVRGLSTKLPQKLREFWKHLAKRRSTIEGYTELRNEYENCFGKSLSRSRLKYKFVDPLIKHGLLELIEKASGMTPPLYRVTESKAEGEHNIGGELDELRGERDRHLREAEELQEKIDLKARRQLTELSSPPREFWKHLAQHGPTFEGYSELQDECESCFGERVPKPTLKYKFVDPLMEHDLLEVVEKSKGPTPARYRVAGMEKEP